MSTRFQAEPQNKLRRSQTGQRKVQHMMKLKTEKHTGRQRMPKRNTVGMPNETALRFIELVKRHRCLWNPQDRLFRNKEQQEKAWNDVAEMIGFSVDELKDKWVSLKSSFRAYQLKFVSDPEKARKWFAFDAIKFLASTSNRSAVSDAVSEQGYDRSHPKKEELTIEVCKGEDGTVDYYEEDEGDEDDGYSVSQTPGIAEECEDQRMNHFPTTSNSSVPNVVSQPPMDGRASVVLDRSIIFGQSISVKMKYLDRQQQMFAEKIISDIMFEAELGNLTEAHVWDIQQLLRNSHASAMKRVESSDQ